MTWTNLILPTGSTTTSFQIGYDCDLMIVEERIWCEGCKKVHYRNEVAIMAGYRTDPKSTYVAPLDYIGEDIGI